MDLQVQIVNQWNFKNSTSEPSIQLMQVNLYTLH